MKEKSLLPKPFYTHAPWDDKTSPLWPATSFYLHRNFKGSLFPAKMSQSESSKMADELCHLLSKMQLLQNPTYLKADELSALDKDFLYEHFLCRESLQNTMKGQAFVIDDTAHFLAIFNVTDHLQMELVDCKNKWEKAWEMLSEIDKTIASVKEMAFSDRFGYLTADPGRCGTGLSVICYLHLPLLIHSKQLDEATNEHLEESVMVSSLEGAPVDYIGDFVLLQNKYSLGLTEEMILRDLHMSATKLTIAEKTLRDRCKQSLELSIKDMVSRAYGLMLHSYQLQTKEVLDALSKIKLGIDLGWISGVSDSKINEVFFTCQRAHIGFVYDDASIDPKLIASRRAEYIHKELKDAKFTS